MARLEPALAYLWPNEGGFTIDSGGPTNYGVTQNTLDAARRKRPDAGYPTDVRDLTRPQAADIYQHDFMPDGFADIHSQQVGTLLFDMGVNSGPHQAVKLMQRAVNACGAVPPLDVDGDLGPKTLVGINATPVSDLIGAFANARIAFYTHLATSNPAEHARDLKGWINRAKKVPPPDEDTAETPVVPSVDTPTDPLGVPVVEEPAPEAPVEGA